MALIRRARPSDAPAIAAVHVASWRATYPGLLPDRYLLGLSPRTETQRWRRMLAFPGMGDAFVAIEAPDGIVGYGTCGRQRPGIEGFAGEFYTLYLVDHVQGMGLGRRLKVLAETLARFGVRITQKRRAQARHVTVEYDPAADSGAEEV